MDQDQSDDPVDNNRALLNDDNLPAAAEFEEDDEEECLDEPVKQEDGVRPCGDLAEEPSTPTHNVMDSFQSPESSRAKYYAETEEYSTKNKAMFGFIILLQVLLNYDSGGIAQALDRLTTQFGLTLMESGSLGAIVYLGLTTSCVWAGTLLQACAPKRVLGIALCLNCGWCFLFAASPSKYTIMAARFGVGVSQALLVIFAPVWVDDHAPRSACTTWMSLIQAGVPLGVMLGYATTGLLDAYTDWSWRVTFYIQSILLAFCCIAWFFIPSSYINPPIRVNELPPASPIAVSPSGAELITRSASTSAARLALSRNRYVRNAGRGIVQGFHHFKFVCFQVGHLFRNGLYICTCLALCSSYFVVTGIQFWVTSYLGNPPISANKEEIVYTFTFTSATAPIMGVLFGGFLVDRMGGYQNQMHKAARVSCIFAFLACCCATPAIFTSHFSLISLFIWLLLFFGAGTIPASTGILLACVSREMRPVASGISMLLYNLLGYAAGPFVSGFVAEMAGDLRWTFRLLMLWTWTGFFTMMIGWQFTERRVRQEQKTFEQSLPSISLVL